MHDRVGEGGRPGEVVSGELRWVLAAAAGGVALVLM